MQFLISLFWFWDDTQLEHVLDRFCGICHFSDGVIEEKNMKDNHTHKTESSRSSCHKVTKISCRHILALWIINVNNFTVQRPQQGQLLFGSGWCVSLTLPSSLSTSLYIRDFWAFRRQARHMKIESTFWLSLGSLADVSNSSMLWASANLRAVLEGTWIWSNRSHLLPTRTRGTEDDTLCPLHSWIQVFRFWNEAIFVTSYTNTTACTLR